MALLGTYLCSSFMKRNWIWN